MNDGLIQPFGEAFKKLLAAQGLTFVVDALDSKFTIVPAPKPAK